MFNESLDSLFGQKNLPEGNKLAKLRRCIAMVPIHHNPTIPHILSWSPTWGWGNRRSKYAAYARAVSSEPHLFRHQHRGALPSLLDADMPCYATFWGESKRTARSIFLIKSKRYECKWKKFPKSMQFNINQYWPSSETLSNSMQQAKFKQLTVRKAT